MSSLKIEEGGFTLGSEATDSVFRSVNEAEVSLDEMLSLACRQGKQDIVELLLESGANVNHRNKAGNTPLLEACSQGHVSIAKLLLDRSADIDAPTETTFDSALTWACTLGNIEIVTILLEHKANVEHRTKDGCTALMFAALAGHEKVAKLLLDHKARINVESDSNKDSPLTFACWKGHQKVVKLFLERKANIEHRTKEGFSPLMFAALGGHTQVAELLLKHKAEVNTPSGSNNDIPLTSACWKGHHQVVHLLLQHDSDIEHRTKDGCTPLMLAAREGHLSVAKLLLEHNAKVNVPSGSENNIPLTLACWKGHRDVVELLLDNASNIEHQNKAGCTPLMLAAREGHLEATQLLLDSGAQINVPSGSNDDTPLTLACWKGHDEVVQLLIDHHSSVNHQTKTGCTPLMEATREGHVGVARLLLEAGADVETPDNYGQSPFFMACWKGHADVAALLLEYEANKDCRTKTGITPLFQACRENHVDVVKLLLDYGCNPSTPFPNSRECPLTLAAEKGYNDLAQLLLSHGANVETRTKKGCSPFFLSCKEGFTGISVMLAKHGANIEAPDQRGTTPLLAAYKNGCVEVVEWLLVHVAHLPSDQECQKALMSPMPADTDLLPQRSKCLDLIMKAKKAREQAALKNAQSLFEELAAEQEKKDSKRKAAAKKRDKRKLKKKREQEKAEAMCGDEEEEGNEDQPVEGRQDPELGVVNDEPLTPAPSAEQTAPALPLAASNKKHRKKSKNKKSKSSQNLESTHVALATTTSSGYLSDSADSSEFHDAQSELPDCRPEDHTLSKPTSNDRVSSQDSVKSLKPDPHPLSRHQPTSRQPSKLTSQVNLPPSSKPDVDKAPEKPQDKARTPPPLKNQKDAKTPSKGGYQSKNRSQPPVPVPTTTQGAVSTSVSTATSSKARAQVSNSTEKISLSKSGTLLNSSFDSTRDEQYSPNNGMGKSPRIGQEQAGSSSKQLSNKVTHISTSNNSQGRNSSVSPAPSNQSLYDSNAASQDSNDKACLAHDENVWNTEAEWEGIDLVMLSRYSTDDEKIRSQKLQAAVQAQTYTPTTRPTSTAALPTPSTLTTNLSPSTPVTSGSTVASTSQSWQEVTRTTRTVQLTVSNNLVGRIIGRGGSKINSIQDASGAHINVSRNIPKSTDRLITIRGTQKSITRAKELIDEALSTPDSALVSATPSPVPSLDGDPRLAPSVMTHTQRSVSPAAQPPKKKYAEVIPTLTTVTSPPSHTPLTTTVSETSQYFSTSVSSTINTLSPPCSRETVSSTSKPVCTFDSKSSKPNPWSHEGGGGSFAAVAAAAGSSSAHSQEERPHPPVRPSSSLSSTSKLDTREVDFSESLESNTDFPPLNHARSQSDPQGTALSEEENGGKDRESQSITLQMAKFPLANKLPPSHSFSPAKPEVAESPDHSSSGLSEKLPFSSPDRSGSDVIDEGEDRSPNGGPFRAHSKSEGQVIGIKKESERLQQSRMSLPPKPLAMTTEGDTTSDIPADLPAQGNYGAIGQPSRKTSLPSVFDNKRKSYAGLHFPSTTLENLGENDPLTSHPPPGTATTQAGPEGVSFSEPEASKRRQSWAGHNLQGHVSFPPPQAPPFIPKTHHHSRPELFSPRSPRPPYQDTPLHHHGSYGPIGSNIPSTVGLHTTKSHSLPNPHTPPPYPHMFNRADMWAHTQPASIAQSRQPNVVSFPPPRPGGFHPQSFPSSGPPLPFSPAPPLSPQLMGPKQKPGGNFRPARHRANVDEQFTFHALGGQWGGSQKRWSVPGYNSIPRPAVPLNPIWGQPSGQGMFVSDQSGEASQFLSGSGSLAMNNPWGPSWSNPSNARMTPPASLPPMSLHFPANSTSSSVTMTTTASSWQSSSGETDEPEECVGDLGQLLKRLDISDEHVHALKARKLSLQQLHSMSDEEWRSLKLPVGPRVKLMNAVSNIPLGGDESKGEGKATEPADDQAPSFGTMATSQSSDPYPVHFSS